mmetsp:Transcript_58450/g.139057  ORF Transcript_58450/g.139057 Transcript_58450/m.139057 type:complete len:233 (+) Transcript_58450:166-864(+)
MYLSTAHKQSPSPNTLTLRPHQPASHPPTHTTLLAAVGSLVLPALGDEDVLSQAVGGLFALEDQVHRSLKLDAVAVGSHRRVVGIPGVLPAGKVPPTTHASRSCTSRRGSPWADENESGVGDTLGGYTLDARRGARSTTGQGRGSKTGRQPRPCAAGSPAPECRCRRHGRASWQCAGRRCEAWRDPPSAARRACPAPCCNPHPGQPSAPRTRGCPARCCRALAAPPRGRACG